MAAPVTDTTTLSSTAPSEPTSTAPRSGGIGERDLGLLLIRLVLGVVFIGHGAQKLFGWFGGNGIDGTAQFFESAGYSPGKLLAVMAGLGEFGGGILLVLGLGTSFAGAALVATMAGATAVTADAGNNAFFAMNNGYEFQLVLTVLALGITLTGAGRLALDHGRFWDRAPLRYGLAAAGVVVGLVTVLVR